MSAILAQYMKAPNNKDMLVLERRDGTYHLYNHEIGLPFDDSNWPRMPGTTVEVNTLCLVYCEHQYDENGKDCWYTNNSEHWPLSQLEEAKAAFYERLDTDPFGGTNKGYSIPEVYKLDHNIPL